MALAVNWALRAEAVGVVVTVMNMKGGVGKTTVAMHLAGILARFKLGNAVPRRVLAIDYDPQFNMSQALLPPKRYFDLEKARKTTLAVLIEDDTELDPFEVQVAGNHKPPAPADVVTRIYGTSDKTGYLDLLPATLDLMYVALGPATMKVAPIEERFAKFIDQCRAEYDVIIIDCHPAGSLFTQTSLRASDHVIIPVAPQRYAVRGVGLMVNFISSKQVGDKPPMPHILFNAVPRFGVTAQEADIRTNERYSSFCLKSTLKKYKAFADPEGGVGFVWVSSRPYGTEALGNLLTVAAEIVDRTKT
jgi:chromosome partitioning protein